MPTSSDIFKRNLEDLGSFDNEISNTAHKLGKILLKEFLFLDAVEKGKRGLSGIRLNEGLMIKHCRVRRCKMFSRGLSN